MKSSRKIKWQMGVLGLVIYVIGVSAFAQTSVTRLESVSADRNTRKIFTHVGTIDYQYEEPGLMKVSGRLTQIGAGYRHAFLKNTFPFYLEGVTSFAAGNLTYDGALVDTSNGKKTPITRTSKDQIFNFEGHFGNSFFDSSFQALDVFAGLGYWDLHDSTEGEGTYDRQITYYYLPIGTRYNLRIKSSLNLFVGAQYNLFLTGKVSSKLSQASSAFSDVDNTQSKGSGSRLNAGAEWSFLSWSLFAEAYYQAWKVDDSDSSTQTVKGKTLSFREPENETKMVGINIGGRF